jgi:large subunit ribosomal protein L1
MAGMILPAVTEQSDQMVRGIVRLPNRSGKPVRVLVFTEKPGEAIAAGSDFARLDDVIAKIQGGWLDSHGAISTTSAIKEVRNVARILGPRGIMPNPKSGCCYGIFRYKRGKINLGTIGCAGKIIK